MTPEGQLAIQCLEENLNLLTNAFGATDTQNIPMFNISQALRGIYLDLLNEFQNTQMQLHQIESRLSTLEQRLRH